MKSVYDVPMTALALQPLPQPFSATVTPPGSKSLTNRALVLAALAGGAHQRQELAARQLQVDAVQDLEPARADREGLGQAARLEGERARAGQGRGGDGGGGHALHHS